VKLFGKTTLLILFLCAHVFAQEKKDTVSSSTAYEKNSGIPAITENKFNPKSSFKLFKEDFTIPYDLKKYSAIMSLDTPAKNTSNEEKYTGLSGEELESFRLNKNSTLRMLSEFYGEDLVDIQKLLDSVGLTKDQIVGILMALKFVFGQSLIR